MITPANEYAELRREILQWQQLRIVVLAAIMAAVTTSLVRIDGVRWELISGMLLFIVLVGQLFSLYAARGNAKLSAYIQVFCEGDTPGWETRSRAFTRDFATGYFNRVVALVYLALAAASVYVPPARCAATAATAAATAAANPAATPAANPECFTAGHWSRIAVWYLVGGLASFVLALGIWEWVRGSPREVFKREWERIKSAAPFGAHAE